ncbi:MAG: hypothetical protein WDN08_13505 [Rhizomicrobium sp.]
MTLALAGLLMCGAVSAAEPHRLYDRKADCAVFGVAGLAAIRAEWDGPCVRGLAAGRGTATFFDKDGKTQALTASFRDGAAQDGDAELRWSDGAHYAGQTADGAPSGHGILTNGAGDRYEGEWKDGALNGRGSVVWANGDRYEGDWVGGKAEGHGVQVWANGETYDGAWHNDLPNGQGTLTRKDGTRDTALFVDGKKQAPPVAAAQPVTPPAEAVAPPTSLLEGFAGKTLVGVDGSAVTLAAKEGGLLRTLTTPDGAVHTAAFSFLGNGLGTISDGGAPPQVIGFFRVLPASVEFTYADGHSEILTRSAAEGLALVLKSATGEQACTTWYPAGHVFSAEERKAAVAAYARRLGVGDAAPRNSCAAAPPASPRGKPARAAPNALQTVPVKPSTVHPIDGPTEVVPVDASAIVDEAIASNCLKVDSDGSYWGFRNHCGYAVQFAYCLLHGVDAIAACGDGGVPGSVSADGFGALFSDTSIAERGTERDFRWVGCRGGAGEVVARLDKPEPASGRCLRAGRTAAREN